MVLSIPISWSFRDDFLLWHFDKSGAYTVQSGYRVACSQNSEALVSNSSISCKWWNTLWSLNLPPKVRIFVWRACLIAMPSLELLWKKNVVESPRCQCCGSSSKSSNHALFGCKVARKTWRLANFENVLISAKHLPVVEVYACPFPF
ncbi:hypothetical protein Ddye_006591 [Dipteronia dyeriana]|uniref:Reverse transcriptase zinc-binding domain-containing protein n=1 Tax=Dipteronia dyeriana TaxID=168575 RepID=A0AAE0CRC1_9ROSI|nr:hypothetical protein Ddye_006591 [Dipteronia dyeriana]